MKVDGNWRLVIIESPYAGDRERNLAYARRALKDSLDRKEAPIASHLLYTQVLQDAIPSDRAMGIAAGVAWYKKADACVVYEDLGISLGMVQGINFAKQMGLPIEYRKLDVLSENT